MIEYKSVVLKCGGSVISDKDAICNVADVIKKLSKQYEIKAIVVSAMGKTTSELYDQARSIAGKMTKRELDTYLVTGEIQSAALLAMRLNAIGVPAHSYDAKSFGIITDDNFGNAKIKKITMQHVCLLNGIPVVAGFQGVTEHGDFTTLGPEGSDITAVWIATVMVADCCWLLKNGGGICDKNPKTNTDARMFSEISYTKMLEILHENRGKSQVLHKRSVQDARRFRKPLFVSSLENPSVGTLITAGVHSKVH